MATRAKAYGLELCVMKGVPFSSAVSTNAPAPSAMPPTTDTALGRSLVPPAPWLALPEQPSWTDVAAALHVPRQHQQQALSHSKPHISSAMDFAHGHQQDPAHVATSIHSTQHIMPNLALGLALPSESGEMLDHLKPLMDNLVSVASSARANFHQGKHIQSNTCLDSLTSIVTQLQSSMHGAHDVLSEPSASSSAPPAHSTATASHTVHAGLSAPLTAMPSHVPVEVMPTPDHMPLTNPFEAVSGDKRSAYDLDDETSLYASCKVPRKTSEHDIRHTRSASQPVRLQAMAQPSQGATPKLSYPAQLGSSFPRAHRAAAPAPEAMSGKPPIMLSMSHADPATNLQAPFSSRLGFGSVDAPRDHSPDGTNRIVSDILAGMNLGGSTETAVQTGDGSANLLSYPQLDVHVPRISTKSHLPQRSEGSIQTPIVTEVPRFSAAPGMAMVGSVPRANVADLYPPRLFRSTHTSNHTRAVSDSHLISSPHSVFVDPMLNSSPAEDRQEEDDHIPPLLAPSVQALLDESLLQFLNDLCSDRMCCFSSFSCSCIPTSLELVSLTCRICHEFDELRPVKYKDQCGDPVHQLLVPKRMARLDESSDFRPFRFRIQAFTNSFQEYMAKRGLSEHELSTTKLKLYLRHQPLIARYNEDGRKVKSRGNHNWIIDARKRPSGGWEFREFVRRIAGAPTRAYLGVPWEWKLRIWDPVLPSSVIRASFYVKEAPSWIQWKDVESRDTLRGVPASVDDAGQVTVAAKFRQHGQMQELQQSFFLEVAHSDLMGETSSMTSSSIPTAPQGPTGRIVAPRTT